MSLATLKKKTQYNVKVNSTNRGHDGFGLNGTHRSQGWVGQELRSRTLVRTLNRGGANRGHGGCCGKYPQPLVLSSDTHTTENPRVVKNTVLNNNGMMRSRFAWIWRPAPYTTVKPDDCHGSGNQGEYVHHINQQTQLCVQSCCACDYYCSKPVLAAMGDYNGYLDSLKSCCSILDAENNFGVSRQSCVQCAAIASTVY